MSLAVPTSPYRAVPRCSPSASVVACRHCGLPCLDQAIARGTLQFCCAGCQTVYEILTENGLGHFYELNTKAGVQIKRPSRREQFLFLDEPAVREKLVDFSDGKTSRVTFTVPSIHCVACVWLLENLFQLKPGIGRSTVNFPKKEVAIQFEDARVTLSELVALLASLGYEPTLSFGSLEGTKPKPTSRKLILQLGLAGFSFGNIMLFSICLYNGLDTWSVLNLKPLFGYISLGLALPVVVYSALDYWRSAWTCIRQRILTIELPIAVGIVAIFAQSGYEVFSKTGEGYFDSLCGLIFFLLIGRWFQQKSYERLSFDRDYKAFFPLSVRRLSSVPAEQTHPHPLQGGEPDKSLSQGSSSPGGGRGENTEEIVPISALNVGDRLLLRQGELIPADARIVSGEGVIDYSFVTGESDPVEKRAGELVYAGGQQMGGGLEIQMTKPVSQSYLTSLWSHETFAKERNDTLDNILNRFTKRFTITVLVVAFGAAAWWWAHGEREVALKAFTSVLIVACPCALALSAPFALGTAQRLLGRQKVFLKSQHTIETLAKVNTIVFDKTGTLTAPGMATVDFHGSPLTESEERALYSMTRHSAHPLAVRIGEIIAKHHSTATVDAFRETPGKGMEARIANQDIWMGSAAWFAERAVSDGTGEKFSCSAHGGSSVHVAINGRYRGCFTLQAALRHDADQLVRQLSDDYELALLSGDNERERARFSTLFGAKANLNFNQSPLNKLGFIHNLQRSGKTVMMVGDGLNDAGALKQSDAGVAVVENIGAFSPASDVIIEAGHVPRLAHVMAFSKDVVRVVWLSIALSSVYNFVGLGIAASGRLEPVVCALLMPLSSISVVGFACLATQWIARRAGLSALNHNLILNPLGTKEGIKITSKSKIKTQIKNGEAFA
jgi:Cu+-exporting ATPase